MTQKNLVILCSLISYLVLFCDFPKIIPRVVAKFFLFTLIICAVVHSHATSDRKCITYWSLHYTDLFLRNSWELFFFPTQY